MARCRRVLNPDFSQICCTNDKSSNMQMKHPSLAFQDSELKMQGKLKNKMCLRYRMVPQSFARTGIIRCKREISRSSMLWQRNRSAMVRESYPCRRATLMTILRIKDKLLAALWCFKGVVSSWNTTSLTSVQTVLNPPMTTNNLSEYSSRSG